MQSVHGKSLDKRLVLAEILRQFDVWESADQLPKGTADNAEKLFAAINRAFDNEAEKKS